ncbi:MAG TPA: nitrite/sulfite reductase, partial [Myxococcota bacterium]|nr:nitrite/sulfite reductase [Myxococcota bacterium]
PPGDATSEEMEIVADLADEFSFGEIRVTHVQNLVLPHVERDRLPDLYDRLREAGLAHSNVGLLSDIICCPGLDYCALANARSIPIAERITERFAERERLELIGEMQIKISGCINACGHHHVGHIGILGVDRKGEEHYQIQVGGSADENAALGKILGRGFSSDEVVDVVEKLVDTYLALREGEERFIDTYRRVGQQPFKESVYGTA